MARLEQPVEVAVPERLEHSLNGRQRVVSGGHEGPPWRCGSYCRVPKVQKTPTAAAIGTEAYSPNHVEGEFSEVRIAPVQHLWAYRAQMGCLRVLSRLPHTTFRMCSTLRRLLGLSYRGYGRSLA